MAGKVFFSVTMSLDGFIAPEERVDDPEVQRWMAQGWNCSSGERRHTRPADNTAIQMTRSMWTSE
jgi:hypothetical protein